MTAVANPHVFGYYKVAGHLEPADYRWTLTSSVMSGAGIGRYSGVDGVSPLDGTPRTASGGAALTGTLPGAAPAAPWALAVGCMGINSSSTGITISSPAWMTEAWDVGGKRHELADGLATGGDKAWRFSAAREWAGWLAALRPR